MNTKVIRKSDLIEELGELIVSKEPTKDWHSFFYQEHRVQLAVHANAIKAVKESERLLLSSADKEGAKGPYRLWILNAPDKVETMSL